MALAGLAQASARSAQGKTILNPPQLAKEKKAELVTGDPEFKPLEKEIKI